MAKSKDDIALAIPTIADRFAASAKAFKAMADNAGEGAKVLAEADRQTEAKGFDANLRVTEYIKPSWEDLAGWNPLTDNDAERAVNALHHKYSPASSKLSRETVAKVMFHAVCSVPEEHAKLARMGSDNAAKPRYDKVPVKAHSTGVQAGHFPGTTADAAKAMLAERDKAAASEAPDTAAIWERGIKAAEAMRNGNYDPIREMGLHLNKLQTRGKRFRSVMFLNVLRSTLEAYAKSNDGKPTKAVGEVWLPCCNAAQAIHKRYWRGAGEAFIPSAADLEQKIMVEGYPATVDAKGNEVKAIPSVNMILGLAQELDGGKVERTEAEILRDLVKRVYKATAALDKEETVGIHETVKAMMTSHPVIGPIYRDIYKPKAATPTPEPEKPAPVKPQPVKSQPTKGNAAVPQRRTVAAPVTGASAKDALAKLAPAGK